MKPTAAAGMIATVGEDAHGPSSSPLTTPTTTTLSSTVRASSPLADKQQARVEAMVIKPGAVMVNPAKPPNKSEPVPSKVPREPAKEGGGEEEEGQEERVTRDDASQSSRSRVSSVSPSPANVGEEEEEEEDSAEGRGDDVPAQVPPEALKPAKQEDDAVREAQKVRKRSEDMLNVRGVVTKVAQKPSLSFVGSWHFQDNELGKFTYTHDPTRPATRKKGARPIKLGLENSAGQRNFSSGDVVGHDEVCSRSEAERLRDASLESFAARGVAMHWSGTFTMANPAFETRRKKRRSIKRFLTIPERFFLTIIRDEHANGEAQGKGEERGAPSTFTSAGKLVCSGEGRNRFGRFSIEGTLDLGTGAFEGTKHYVLQHPRGGDNFDGLSAQDDAGIDGRTGLNASSGQGFVRASKRQRVPNKILRLDTSKRSYAFIARHGNGSALSPSELANASGKSRASLLDDEESGVHAGDISPPVSSSLLYDCGSLSPEPGNNSKMIKRVHLRDVEHVFRKPFDRTKAAAIRKRAQRSTVRLVRQLLREQEALRVHKSSSSGTLSAQSSSDDLLTGHEGDSAFGLGSRRQSVASEAADVGQFYEGDLVDGVQHGHGLCLFVDGKMYEGEWSRGRIHGKGLLWNADGQLVYQGEFADNAISGRGTHLFPNGDRYDGEFRDGLFHGYGVYFDAATGGSFAGDWKRGKRHGHGSIGLPDGSSYVGEWQKDMFSGRGNLRVRDTASYEGSFKDHRFEGRGTVTYEANGNFEGAFRNGVKEGRGTYTFPNRAVYEGRFRHDRIEGFGTLKMHGEAAERLSDDEWIIPISCQSEMRFVHRAAGFGEDGL